MTAIMNAAMRGLLGYSALRGSLYDAYVKEGHHPMQTPLEDVYARTVITDLDSRVAWNWRSLSIRTWALEPDVWLRGITAGEIFQRLTLSKLSTEDALTRPGPEAERLRRRKAFLSPAKAPKDLRREVHAVRRLWLNRITGADLWLYMPDKYASEERLRDTHSRVHAQELEALATKLSKALSELETTKAALAAERERTAPLAELKLAWEWYRAALGEHRLAPWEALLRDTPTGVPAPTVPMPRETQRPLGHVARILDRVFGTGGAKEVPW